MTKNIIFALAAIAIIAFQCKPSGSTASANGTTEHGYKYEHTHKTGGEVAKPGDQALVHYSAAVGDAILMSTWDRSPDGFPFDVPEKASMDTVPAEQLTNFWPFYDAITMMAAGDTMVVYQPIDEKMRRGLPPTIDSTATEIKLTVVVQKVMNKAEAEADAKAKKEAAEAEKMAAVTAAAPHVVPTIVEDLKSYKAGTAKLKTLPSGVKMIVHEAGSGKSITEGENIEVNYYGILTADGSNFDDSYSRGKPLAFGAGVGQMIPGFDNAVMNLRHGAKATIFLPSDLAYGAQGRPGIPANSELAFYIEIL